MTEMILASLVLGLVAGFLAGLFGTGGGAVIVPVLAWLFATQKIAAELIMVMAIATSLATIVFTSIASVITHHLQDAVIWRRVFRLTPGIILGAGGGAIVAHHLDANHLRWILAFFLLYVGLQMALQLKPKPGNIKEFKWLDYSIGIIIGSLSAILGIGGGTLTVPYLVSCRVEMKNAVAISSACGFPIALASSVSFIILGLQQTHLPHWSLGYIYLPAFFAISFCSILTAPFGAKLANRLPSATLKRYFSVVIFILAIKMLAMTGGS